MIKNLISSLCRLHLDFLSQGKSFFIVLEKGSNIFFVFNIISTSSMYSCNLSFGVLCSFRPITVTWNIG